MIIVNNFRSGVSKFVVLLTNEDYHIENRYGIETIEELSDLLKADKKTTAVITKPQFEETYAPLITNTGGKYFYIYEDFSTKLKDFILGKIKAEKGYHVINGASMEPITLKGVLKKNGKIDTNQDGLSDSEEADWEYIKTSGDTITLPTLYDCVKETTGKEERIPEENEEMPERARAGKKNDKNAILNELTKKIRRVESSAREIFIARGYDAYMLYGESWKTIYLGAVGGIIDSCVKDENVWQRIAPGDGWDFARNLLNPVRTLRPSSSQLKSIFFKIKWRK